MPKASQRQFLVRVSDIPDYFMTKSGGNITSSANKVYDGGRIDPDVISSPAEAADVTVSRAYDPFRDGVGHPDRRGSVGDRDPGRLLERVAHRGQRAGLQRRLR
jgi:hypothetical protein